MGTSDVDGAPDASPHIQATGRRTVLDWVVLLRWPVDTFACEGEEYAYSSPQTGVGTPPKSVATVLLRPLPLLSSRQRPVQRPLILPSVLEIWFRVPHDFVYVLSFFGP